MPTTHSPLIVADDEAHKPSLLHRVGAKASHYHARTPYLHNLPFPAITIIVALIVVNLLVWAAVGILLVIQTFQS
jgi:high-affinity nickel-transport protein